MNDSLGSDAAAIIEAARSKEGPSEAHHLRHRAALLARLSAPGAAGASASSGTGAAPAAAASAAKIGLLVGLLVVAGGGVYAVRELRRDTPTVHAGAAGDGSALRAPPLPVAPLPVVPPTSDVAADSALTTERQSAAAIAPSDLATGDVVPPAPREASFPTRSAKSSAKAPSIAAELELLGEAQAAIRARDFVTALAVLGTHASRYPKGALTEERRAFRVISLCGMGRGDAEGAAEEFLRDHPSSPLVGRVREACGRAP
jgi:hypothetical protein